MSIEEIFHFQRVSANCVTAGQPSEEQLHELAEAGFKQVVNLAPHDSENALNDEPASCAALGQDYHYIPVVWEQPTLGDYRQFTQTMDAIGEEKVLVHCAANFRVSAFYALYAMQRKAWSDTQANDWMATMWERYPEYPMGDNWKAFVADIKARIASKEV